MSAPKLLAIETSGAIGSVALAAGDTILERTIATPREQTARVLEIVDALLAEAGLRLDGLDALVFGRGPGSFTGLRVAAAVVQGLGLASGRPILRVSSLAALAQRGLTEHAAESPAAAAGTGEPARADRARVALCCIDARMGEVYSGLFRLESGLAVALGEEQIGPPADLAALAVAAAREGPCLALGDGFEAHAAALEPVLAAASGRAPGLAARAQDLLPQARADLAAGNCVPLEAAVPVYLRGPDAWRRA